MNKKTRDELRREAEEQASKQRGEVFGQCAFAVMQRGMMKRRERIKREAAETASRIAQDDSGRANEQ